MGKRHRGMMTASQTWAQLTLMEREALLGWFLGSYAPSTHAARFPLRKTETLTGAVKAVSANWRGAGT